MNIFAKARNGLNLTPGQRAFLKLLEGLAVAGLVAALPIVAEALSSHGAIVWADVLRTALATGAVAVLLAVVKYLKAQGDTPLGIAAEGVLSSAASRIAAENQLPAAPSVPVAVPDPNAPIIVPSSEPDPTAAPASA